MGEQKNRYLFYYEPGCDAFIPVPDSGVDTEALLDDLDDGETVDVSFKRLDLTESELNDLPEA